MKKKDKQIAGAAVVLAAVYLWSRQGGFAFSGMARYGAIYPRDDYGVAVPAYGPDTTTRHYQRVQRRIARLEDRRDAASVHGGESEEEIGVYNGVGEVF